MKCKSLILKYIENEKNSNFANFINSKNEAGAYRILQTVIRGMIESNPYKKSDLSNKSLTAQARMAIEFRIFEREQLDKLNVIALHYQNKFLK